MIRWLSLSLCNLIDCGQESVAAKELEPVPTKPVTEEPKAPKEEEAPAKVKDVKPRPLSPYAV